MPLLRFVGRYWNFWTPYWTLYWWRCSNNDVSACLNYIGDVTATPMHLSIDRIYLARATKPANYVGSKAILMYQYQNHVIHRIRASSVAPSKCLLELVLGAPDQFLRFESGVA
jgi:hypothetical protein